MSAKSSLSNGTASATSHIVASDSNNFSPTHHMVLSDSHYNKGLGFTSEERDRLKIRGLLPAKVERLETQHTRVLDQFYSCKSNLEKYMYLMALKHNNETLFYYALMNNLKVGEACIKFSSIFRFTDGLYIASEDKGSIRSILDNWTQDVDIIVVTDGSRILGLGDLGANGMGIPIGKLSLYVAGAGFHPRRTLPVLLDAGTSNEEFLKDPLYIGASHKRIDEQAYYAFLDEFVQAVKAKWPSALLQFEDFSNDHCFDLLEKYRNQLLCFNDDIQGTGAVIAAGFINAVRAAGIPMDQHRFVFLGSGSAGIGVADAIVRVLTAQGMKEEEARKKFWMVDSKGLVSMNRGDHLPSFKIHYARTEDDTAYKSLKTLIDVVKYVKPTGIIGLSGCPGTFTEEILREMEKNCKRPIVFALSNPNSKAECSAADAYTFTNGKAIFASGSPWDPVSLNGKTYHAGQGNNMYIFPGNQDSARGISDGMLTVTSNTLAAFVSSDDLAEGCIYPVVDKIREISAAIAAAVMEKAFDEGLAKLQPRPADLLSYVKERMYRPEYSSSLSSRL